jgi:hypothetical protein
MCEECIIKLKTKETFAGIEHTDAVSVSEGVSPEHQSEN